MSQDSSAIIFTQELILSEPIKETVPGTISTQKCFPLSEALFSSIAGYLSLNIIFPTLFQLSA